MNFFKKTYVCFFKFNLEFKCFLKNLKIIIKKIVRNKYNLKNYKKKKKIGYHEA